MLDHYVVSTGGIMWDKMHSQMLNFRKRWWDHDAIGRQRPFDPCFVSLSWRCGNDSKCEVHHTKEGSDHRVHSTRGPEHVHKDQDIGHL